MSDTIKANIDASAADKPLTLEQFEAWEAKYKVERPEVYKARVENGDIERQRVLCGGKLKKEPEEEKEEKKPKVK